METQKIKKIKLEKNTAKKIWDFLWNDDSLLSWIVSLALAFILVKFVFFPLLSLIFASSMPLVVIESGSMHHPGGFFGNTLGLEKNFEAWWESSGSWYDERNITKEQASSWRFRTGMEIGDIVVVSGYGKDKLKVGDIIIFNAGQAHPIIHRIIEIKNINGETFYATKGDNNQGQLASEKEIPKSALVGKAIFRIPKLGWVKLAFVKLFQVF